MANDKPPGRWRDKYDRYLVISGEGAAVPVVVGPFPEGYFALRDFLLPSGYDSASAHATREAAEEEAAWMRHFPE